MSSRPTNQEIMEKLHGLHLLSEEKFKGIHARLDKLNGQTEKNTNFRLLHLGAYKILGILGAFIISAWTIIKAFFHSA